MTLMLENQKTADRSFISKISSALYRYFSRNFRCLQENPRLFLMRKFSRFEIIRNWVRHLKKTSADRYQTDSQHPSLFTDLNIEEAVTSLNSEGYCLGIDLPPYLVQEILEYADSASCLGDRQPNQKFYYPQKQQAEAAAGKRFRAGSYDCDSCAAVFKLINDPGILSIAARFLGTDPLYIASDLMWSFPVEATQFEQLKMAQVFHYDLDDYRAIKFFFYLTDVDETSGPHVTIRGTQKHKRFIHQLLGQRCASITDEKLVQTYGIENVKTIVGQAGFGFAEDPCCFHKGSLPIEKSRLLLQIEYAATNYGDLRNACAF